MFLAMALMISGFDAYRVQLIKHAAAVISSDAEVENRTADLNQTLGAQVLGHGTAVISSDAQVKNRTVDLNHSPPTLPRPLPSSGYFEDRIKEKIEKAQTGACHSLAFDNDAALLANGISVAALRISVQSRQSSTGWGCAHRLRPSMVIATIKLGPSVTNGIGPLKIFYLENLQRGKPEFKGLGMLLLLYSLVAYLEALKGRANVDSSIQNLAQRVKSSSATLDNRVLNATRQSKGFYEEVGFERDLDHYQDHVLDVYLEEEHFASCVNAWNDRVYTNSSSQVQ